MTFVSKIVSDAELTSPDGRPLYRYPLTTETFTELEKALRSSFVTGQGMETAAPSFVLWAAEHIRSRFSGGPLSWDFVLGPLGLPHDDQDLGRELAKRGLCWWERKIKVSDAGIRMFLYSLMAEGGIPEALLKEEGLYRNVVMGLLADIEAEGGDDAEPWAERMASRWISRLPQTFQSTEIARLLADLTLSLAKLRSVLPDDVPEAAAEKWLNEYRQDWPSTIPLRMTPQIAESLIRPALRTERGVRSVVAGPLCVRELRCDETGCWRGYLILHDDGWLPAQLFPDAEGLRLRLLPTGAGLLEGLSYSAAPEDGGWRLRRFGGAARAAALFSLETPFALAAFADGQAKGEAVIDAGFPVPAEAPSLWRAADRDEGAETDRLIPLPGGGRTRAPCLWLLAPDDVEPEVGAGLTLKEIGNALHGLLWRVSGKGVLRLGEQRYSVETGAEGETPEARLFVFGKTFRGWRLDSNVPIYRGDVAIHGQIGAAPPRRLGKGELRCMKGRMLGDEVVEWVRNDEVLARFRFVGLPPASHFDLREEAPGRVVFTAKGLETGWRVQLGAGTMETRGDLEGGAIRLLLETQGAAPGLVRLRLSEPVTGRTLELQAAWPAQKGMILDPDGIRLAENRPMSVETLYGWRAVAPEGVRGDLQLQLAGYRAISLPVAGEMSLASIMPLIRVMLAQGGPDAQVNLCLVVSGQESHRLEIRRYHDQTVVEDGTLRMGLDRDSPTMPETTLAAQLNKMRHSNLHAVDINGLKQIGPIEAGASVDLRDHLGDTGGPWLIQSRLNGRIQRAVVWSPHTRPETSREDRINDYAERWQRLVSDHNDPGWDRSWQLIMAARQGGDAGAFDQVQALARVSVAAISLALRVPREELSEVLALESAVSIFWPTLSVSDFVEAIKAEHTRLREKMTPYFDEQEAEAEADIALARRVGDILARRPELAGHLCKALLDSELLLQILKCLERPEILLISNPDDRFLDVTQEAVRRFDRLPQGVGGLKPHHPPGGLPSFNPYAQSMIDAPLVAAEMAAGLRSAPDVREKLVLINLRLVDPLYFDTALPAALTLLLA